MTLFFHVGILALRKSVGEMAAEWQAVERGTDGAWGALLMLGVQSASVLQGTWPHDTLVILNSQELASGG